MDSATSSSALPWEHDIYELYADKEAWKEGVHLEFKKSQTKLSEDLWETYSAFANTEGGIIILGVKDNGTVQGVENVPQQMKNLTTSLNNIEKVSCNVSLAPGMVESIELGGRNLIVIRVPKAEASQKPVYLNRNTSKAYFRQNESDICCTEDMLQQMLRDKSAESPTSRLVPYTSFSDIDPETWEQYRTIMRAFNPKHAWVRLNDQSLLERLGGYIRDKRTGLEGLTLAGLLMFGSDEAIRSNFQNHQINYYAYDGTEQLSSLRRWRNRITMDGTWAPNLFQFFYRVLPLISEPLRTPFKLNPDMTTAQGESSAHVAVREALANAIVHADYYGIGGIIVRQYTDRLELSNPGTLLVPKEHIYKGGLSRCRNGALQSMFQTIGVVDKAGTGVDKILTGWLDQCLIPPSVDEERNGLNRVTWTLPYMGLLPKSYEAELMRLIGVRLYDSLDAVRRNILMIVQAQGSAGHKEIHRLLPFIHSVDLTRILSSLVQSGFLRSEGHAVATRYSLAAVAPHTAEINSTHKEGVAPHISSTSSSHKEGVAECTDGDISTYNGDTPLHISENSSTHKEGVAPHISNISSTHKEPGITFLQVEESLSEELRAALVAYRNKKRNSREETDDMILAICRGRWVTLPILSQLLNRNAGSLRERHLQGLSRYGQLRRRYDSPNHWNQAYTTEE